MARRPLCERQRAAVGPSVAGGSAAAGPGWPADGAQEVVGGLVEALNAEIDRTPESNRRSVLVQVRDGLIGAARDVAIAYVEKKTGIS
jgi:hypothetical protein